MCLYEICHELFYQKEGSLYRKSNDKRAGGDANGYRQLTINKKRYYEHRLVYLMNHGHMPKHEIDHINGIKDDNRISNLVDVTHKENMQNLRPYSNSSSGLLGVNWHCTTKLYMARMRINGKIIHLGSFYDFFEACCARKSYEAKNIKQRFI